MKKIGLLIIIMGIIILSYPWFVDFIYTPYFLSRAQEEMRDIDSVTIISNNHIIENKTNGENKKNHTLESIDQNNDELSIIGESHDVDIAEQDKTDFFDFSEVKYVDASLKQYEAKYNYVIGWLQIPAVDLDLPIFYGVKNDHLFLGAGTMKVNQKMGEGNYALAGHDSRNSKLYFSPIHKLKEGDLIYSSNGSFVYTYKVSEIFIVEPTAVEVIEDREGIKEMTLVTCTDDGKRRLIVKGNFIEKVEGYHR